MPVIHNDYHTRREAQERAQAAKSPHDSTRRLYLDLADRHAGRIVVAVPETA